MATSKNARGMAPIEIRRQDGRIWSHVRNRWLVETPEERVRQEYLLVLINEYGYALNQIGEELEVTGRGSGRARADFVIWSSTDDKRDGKNPLIVVECKSSNRTITTADYAQGDSYSRQANARFFVTHNGRETRYWRVLHDRMPKYFEEIENIPHAEASNAEIQAILDRQRVFREEEFADLLQACHDVIRNREKKDPAAAFDEIAKILFVKVGIERRLRDRRSQRNLFTAEQLREMRNFQDDPINALFEQTKQDYSADRLFKSDEKISLRHNTAIEIVLLLERYNLSDTSEDIKGIAFERFLGRTFRGEIGQFFTPRSIVKFMLAMIDPKEGDVVCDPACGSGGFLIRFFEEVREQILADVDRDYAKFKDALDVSEPEELRAAKLRVEYDRLQASVDQSIPGSRLWQLANRCVYGTDANDRMARTAKMNMIMHGDGHGGVHHHDGFLNVNGIFEGRFNIILTNPPFGSSVEPSDIVLDSEIHVTPEDQARYEAAYGARYVEAQARLSAARGQPIASLFELPKSVNSKIKTEVLFMERCLDLLEPGGRLGIVIPDGVLNSPSLGYVRDFCEDRAILKAVVSLPVGAFMAAGATVKTSLVFMQKFTNEQRKTYEAMSADSRDRAETRVRSERAVELAEARARLESAEAANDRAGLREANRLSASLEATVAREVATLARELLRQTFDYDVFLYEAERVGITSTGSMDANELLPEDNTSGEPSCLTLYREFEKSWRPPAGA